MAVCFTFTLVYTVTWMRSSPRALSSPPHVPWSARSTLARSSAAASPVDLIISPVAGELERLTNSHGCQGEHVVALKRRRFRVRQTTRTAAMTVCLLCKKSHRHTVLWERRSIANGFAFSTLHISSQGYAAVPHHSSVCQTRRVTLTLSVWWGSEV